MASIRTLLTALDEREIARRVGLPHDEARIRYRLERNTVDTFDQFADGIGDYYNHHVVASGAGGALLECLHRGLIPDLEVVQTQLDHLRAGRLSGFDLAGQSAAGRRHQWNADSGHGA